MSTYDFRRAPAGAATDRELSDALLAAGDGDRTAFDFVYRATWSRLHARSLAVLADAHVADEVVQDVMAEVWLTAHKFDPDRGSAMAWLNVIARNRATDRARAMQTARRRDQDDAEHRARLGSSPDIADLIATRLAHVDLRNRLVLLSPLQLESLVLAFYGGHTYREVAELLDVPLGTVKARIRDGLIRLAGVVDRADA